MSRLEAIITHPTQFHVKFVLWNACSLCDLKVEQNLKHQPRSLKAENIVKPICLKSNP